MDESLVAVAHRNGGYLMRHQLNDLGVSDPLIRQLMRAGHLTRVRHGTYVPTVLLTGLDASARYAIIVRSVIDKLGPGVAASHQSAAALHGLDLWGVDLSAVHVTRLDSRSGRTEAGVVFHEGRLKESDCVRIDGRLATSAERTSLETATTIGIESGVVLLSSGMRQGLLHQDSTEEALVRDLGRWQGARTARIALRLSDGRLESVGEARSIVMMWQCRVPAPELQFEVYDDAGRLVGRSDFSWAWYRHLGEFDGFMKYGRLNPYSRDPGQQITREKVREDDMRATRRGMTRWTWVELGGSEGLATGDRILRDLDRSRRLFTRHAVHIV